MYNFAQVGNSMYQLNNAAEYLIMTAARLPDKLAFADDGQGFTFAELLHASMSAGGENIQRGGRNKKAYRGNR